MEPALDGETDGHAGTEGEAGVSVDETDVERFWDHACHVTRFTSLPGYLPPGSRAMLAPPAWSFGGTATEADLLVRALLDGERTATAAPRRDYDREGLDLPQVGSMGIVVDGRGAPRALVETTEVSVVRQGEITEALLVPVSAPVEADDAVVVLERFRVLHPKPSRSSR